MQHSKTPGLVHNGPHLECARCHSVEILCACQPNPFDTAPGASPPGSGGGMTLRGGPRRAYVMRQSTWNRTLFDD